MDYVDIVGCFSARGHQYNGPKWRFSTSTCENIPQMVINRPGSQLTVSRK